MKEIELYRLSTGEKIVHVPETHSIVVRFNAPKKVLSTSLLNGGCREDIKGLFNYTCCGPGSCMSLENMRSIWENVQQLWGLILRIPRESVRRH